MLGDVWLVIKKCYDDTKFQRGEQKNWWNSTRI